jgi:transposase
MAKKHTYRAIDVDKIDVAKLVPLLATACVLAIDVAKSKFVAGIATMHGVVQQVFRFVHPKQTAAVLSLIEQLRQAGLHVEVVMEPTGIYGDCVRHQCRKAGCEVFMVRPKYTHDMAEVLDGVPSMHDGKAVHVLSQLHALGKSTRWVPPSEEDRNLRALVDLRRFWWTMLRPAHGQMEALLSKWWPELEGQLDCYASKSARKLLMRFGGPWPVAFATQQAKELLRRESHGKLSAKKIEAALESAANTVAEPASEQELEFIKEVVGQVDELSLKIEQVDELLEPLVRDNEVMSRMAQVLGTGTAAVVFATVGSPKSYSSAKAYEKAMGLNLKVRSSGERSGQLTITKRGNSDARQLMYLAALRHIQKSQEGLAWYRNRKAYQGGLKKKAVVAVMRKLVRALWHVARGQQFDPRKLYDLRRLKLEAQTTQDFNHSHEAA